MCEYSNQIKKTANLLRSEDPSEWFEKPCGFAEPRLKSAGADYNTISSKPTVATTDQSGLFGVVL